MSSTELYGLTKNKTLDIGDATNSWRGAMAVWGRLEKKYLPKFTPAWAVAMGDADKEYSRCSDMSNPNSMQPIWDLVDSEKVSLNEKIVLFSTFDNVLVKRENVPRLLKAFREFGGETNLTDQADIIEEAIKVHPEILAIGWNQSSVNGDNWGNVSYDEETEESIGYNLETESDHSFLFDELEEE